MKRIRDFLALEIMAWALRRTATAKPKVFCKGLAPQSNCKIGIKE